MFKEKEDDIEVAPDTGEPVTELNEYGVKEKAFDTLVEDEEKAELKEQEENEEIKKIESSYVAGDIY